MLVRKVKCHTCGANKINEITTGYIYCDYCGTFMGYDMDNIMEETTDVFSLKNYTKAPQKAFIKASQDIAAAINEKNKEKFVNAQVELQEIQYELFPKRYGPKAKQPAYRKKHLKFYKKFWQEKVDKGYLEEADKNAAMFNKYNEHLKSEIIDGKPAYQIDDHFKEYIDAISEFNMKSVEESMKMEAMADYPEVASPATKELLYKQGINNFIQQLHVDTSKFIIEHLGLQSEYIDMEPVELSEVNCMVCNTTLKVPEGSESIVCETCGGVNQVKSKEIKCLNCSAPFEPNEKNECPYCGSKMVGLGKSQKTEEQKSESVSGHSSKKKSGGFFSKLFGKN